MHQVCVGGLWVVWMWGGEWGGRVGVGKMCTHQVGWACGWVVCEWVWVGVGQARSAPGGVVGGVCGWGAGEGAVGWVGVGWGREGRGICVCVVVLSRETLRARVRCNFHFPC